MDTTITHSDASSGSLKLQLMSQGWSWWTNISTNAQRSFLTDSLHTSVKPWQSAYQKCPALGQRELPGEAAPAQPAPQPRFLGTRRTYTDAFCGTVEVTDRYAQSTGLGLTCPLNLLSYVKRLKPCPPAHLWAVKESQTPAALRGDRTQHDTSRPGSRLFLLPGSSALM